MSSFLPRLGGAPKKPSSSFQTDNIFASPKAFIAKTPSYNASYSNISNDYQASQRLLAAGSSENYIDLPLKKPIANSEKLYLTKASSESSKPFPTNNGKCMFNVDISDLTTHASDKSIKTSIKRMFSRPNKVSDDRDLLNFTSNSTLNTDLKIQFEGVKTDRSGESTPSPFDLTPYHQKSGVTKGRHDYSLEGSFKNIANGHTNQTYQYSTRNSINSKPETPKIVKFNSASSIGDVPTNYNGSLSSRFLPALSLQNLPMGSPNKIEPASARARLGFEKSLVAQSPFNVGLQSLKSPISSCEKTLPQQQTGQVFSFRGSLTEFEAVPGAQYQSPVKQNSFDLTSPKNSSDESLDLKLKTKTSSQPYAGASPSSSSVALIRSHSFGAIQETLFKWGDNDNESVPVSSETSATQAKKPILKVRDQGPSSNEPFLKSNPKKVVFELVQEEDNEDDAAAVPRPKLKLRLKRKAKKETKPTLKSILWGIALTPLLKDIIKNKQENRSLRNKEFTVNFLNDKEIFLQFAGEHLKESIIKIAHEKTKLSIAGPKGTIKNINSRCLKIHDLAFDLLDKFKLALEANYLPKPIYKNIIESFQNGVCVPDYYLSEFELSRLEISPAFSLKCMTKARSKMLIGGYMVLRIFIMEVIMRPWQVTSKVQISKVDKSNLQIVASVLYHALKEIFSDSLEPIEANSGTGDEDNRVKAGLEVPDPTVLRRDPTVQSVALAENAEEIMKGFVSRDNLSELIEERAVLFNDLKKYLIDILGYLHRVTYKGQKRDRAYFIKNY